MARLQRPATGRDRKTAQDIDVLRGRTAAIVSGSGSLPTGGLTGQVLAKASGADLDCAWVSPYGKETYIIPGVPSGGDDSAVVQAGLDTVTGDDAVYLPQGTWRVNNLTWDGTRGLNLLGAGSTASYLKHVPTNDGDVALTVVNSTPGQATYCSISRIGISTTDATYDKTGLKLTDIGQLSLNEVTVTGFGGAGTDSVGLHTLGRQSLWARDLRLTANIPLRIGTNPNTTLGYLSADHFTFMSAYFTNLDAPATLTWATVLIDPTAHISQLQFKGGAWRLANGSCHGLHWNMGGTDVYAYSSGLMLDSIRTESGGSASTWSVYLNPTVNSELRNFTALNCEFDTFKNGIYARNVRCIGVEGSILGHVAGKTLMDVDNYRVMNWRNVYTKASSGSLNVGSGKSIQWEVPETATYDYPHTASWGA